MVQSAGNGFSVDDSHLVELNQLGTPLSIYRLKPEVIRFFRRACLFVLLFGILIIVVGCVVSIVNWHQLFPLRLFAMIFTGGLWVLIIGIYTLSIDVPRFQSERVIVCERGLLRVRKWFRKNRVEVVHWVDIVDIGKKFTLSLTVALFKRKFDFIHQSYVIMLQQRAPLILDSQYQDVDEMIAVIKQRSGEA